MELQILRPINSSVYIEGKISYHEARGSWDTIRFQRRLVNEFPQLKDKRACFSYKMILHKSFKDLKKEIEKLRDNEEALPILLFLCKEKQEFPNQEKNS